MMGITEIYGKLKINMKKDLIMTFVVFAVFILIGLICYTNYIPIIGIMIILFGFVYVITHYMQLKATCKQLIMAKEIAFNGFYRYVVTMLTNGKILYDSLLSSVEYVDKVLVDDVNKLISEIEEDTTLDPFLNFCDNFNDENIKQMIIMLYKSQEVGCVDNVLENINECMVYLQDSSINKYIEIEGNKIDKYSFMPLVLSALVMIIFSMFILNMIGSDLIV